MLIYWFVVLLLKWFYNRDNRDYGKERHNLSGAAQTSDTQHGLKQDFIEVYYY